MARGERGKLLDRVEFWWN